MSDVNIFNKLNKLLQNGDRAVLCTLIEKEGHGPRDLGAKILVDPYGSVIGTIGGGGMERRIVKEALEAMTKGPRILHFAMGVEPKGDAVPVDSKCGGSVKVLLDVIKPDPRLIIVGSGYIAQALGDFAHRTGYNIIVVDDAETAKRENFPYADVYNGLFEKELERVHVKNSDFVTIVHGETKYELAALRSILSQEPSYLGLLGSINKYDEHINQLKKDGYSREDLSRIKGPIGLDIGAETPEEIAISILAEIIQIKHGWSSKS